MSLFDLKNISEIHLARVIRSIPAYDMHELARQEIREHLEAWGITAEQAGQLLNASSEEIAQLSSTIQKRWQWEQFADETLARIARLSAEQQELEGLIKQMAGDAPERAAKVATLEQVRQELKQQSAVRQDQFDALRQIETTVHALTRTAGRRNALIKMLEACPGFDADSYGPGDNIKILTELQAYCFQNPTVISDNGQTFETRELLKTLERQLTQQEGRS